MTKPLNGWTKIVGALVALVLAVSTAGSVYWCAVARIEKCEAAIVVGKEEREDMGDRLRFIEFVLIRMADKQGIDVSGFK